MFEQSVRSTPRLAAFFSSRAENACVELAAGSCDQLMEEELQER